MPEEPQIIQYSPPRSGSTLITQMLKELFPNVKKSHEFEQTSGPIVIAFRHPCSNFASLCRIRAKTDNYGGKVFSLGSIKDLKRIRKSVRSVKKAYRCLKRYTDTYQESPLYLQYETFSDSYPFIFKAFESYFGIQIDEAARAEIEQKTSRDANATISKTMNKFSEYDQSTGIHGHHVSTAELKWDEQIPPFLRFMLRNVLLRKEIQLYTQLSQR